MTILSILAAILLLGILVTIHEFGHFIAARLTGILVQQFSVGFGPKLVGWKSKKYETEFMIRGIPLGGYCMFYGEDDAQGKHVDDPRAYNRQSVWKRMFSVLMGPLMNFVLAFVVAVFFFLLGGVYEAVSVVENVEPSSPAAQAGLMPGDVLYNVQGQETEQSAGDALIAAASAYREGDDPLQIQVDRKGDIQTLLIKPFFDQVENRYRIGVSISLTAGDKTVPVSFPDAVRYGYKNCVSAGTIILGGLKNLVFKGEGLENSAGPVGIVQVISQQTREFGLRGFFNLLIVFSINLGLINLLPIPGLDGSRFLFMLVEAVRRKPINQRAEAMVHFAGYVLLLGIMIFFTYQDVLRLLQ